MFPTLTVGIAAFKTLTGDKEQNKAKNKKNISPNFDNEVDMEQCKMKPPLGLKGATALSEA